MYLRFLKVFLCYLILALPAYFSAIYIMHPTDEKSTYFAFVTGLIFTIAYLVSLRFLSNPTKKTLILKFFILDEFIVPERKEEMRRLLKERISSFYFAFTEVVIFYFIVIWLYSSISVGHTVNPLEQFYPEISSAMFWIFIGAFLFALFVSTAAAEALLEYLEPIEQL